MKNDTFDIKDSEVMVLLNSPEQKGLFEAFKRSRDNNDPNNQQIRIMNFFMMSLTPMQKFIIRHWQKQQLCRLSPDLICSLELSKFALDNELKDSIILSEDGKKYIFIVDQNRRDEVVAKLKETYPTLNLEINNV